MSVISEKPIEKTGESRTENSPGAENRFPEYSIFAPELVPKIDPSDQSF